MAGMVHPKIPISDQCLNPRQAHSHGTNSRSLSPTLFPPLMRSSVPIAAALIALSSLPASTQGATPAPAASTSAPAEVKAAPAAAPQAKTASQRGAAAAAPTPEATPASKKPGFFGRMFGKKGAATPAPATPAATPTPATPKPRSKPRKSEQPAEAEAPERTTTKKKPEPESHEAESKPAASETAKPSAETEKPASESTASTEKAPAAPAPGKRGGKRGSKTAAATEEQSKPEEKKTKEQLAVEKAVASGDPEAIEKAKYDEVKSRALQDEKVKELKAKADSATTEEEGRKALRAYNKALFQKMRGLDSSVRDRVDRMETAVMKRLEGSGE